MAYHINSQLKVSLIFNLGTAFEANYIKIAVIFKLTWFEMVKKGYEEEPIEEDNNDSNIES